MTISHALEQKHRHPVYPTHNSVPFSFKTQMRGKFEFIIHAMKTKEEEKKTQHNFREC